MGDSGRGRGQLVPPIHQSSICRAQGLRQAGTLARPCSTNPESRIPAYSGCSQIRVHISPNRRLACQGQDSCSGRISSIPPSVTRATAKLKL
jgi:hypothetical protein